MVFDVNDTLTKPTYNVSDYGQTIMIPLVQDTALTLQTITPSTSSFDKSSISSTVFDVNDINQIVSNVDEISIAHEGDDTAFNRIYQWTPEGYGIVYKTNIIAAFGENVSAFSSGSVDLTSVRAILTRHKPDGTLIGQIFDYQLDATLTALTATGTQVFIVNIRWTKPFEILLEETLRLQLIVNETTSGTNTRQVGIIPFFCFNSEATNKVFTTSIWKMHIHPSIKNAYPVLRGTSVTDAIDFGGVSKDGVSRGS